MIPFTVRLADDRDANAMAGIACRNLTAPQWTAAQFAEMLRPRPEGSSLCRVLLVAEAEGQPAGFAVASALCVVFPVEAELESIAVAPAMQARGIGRALLQAAVDWAAEQRAASLRLEVRAGNARAIRMYSRAGFQQTGIRRGYYADPAEDAIVMERIPGQCEDDLPASSLA